MKGLSLGRIRLISGIIIFITFLLVTKLYFVQVVNGKEFREKAERQYVSPSKAIFERGSLFFQYKDGVSYTASTVKSGFLLAINPKLLMDAEAAYKLISPILPINKQDFLAKAAKKDDVYEEISKRIDEEVAAQIQELKIPGVQLVREKWRYYPGGDLAAHVLGFVGFKGDQLLGQYGLEKSYEDTLKRSSSTVYVNFFAEIFSNLSKTVSDSKELEGDVITSIEPAVQQMLEKEIAGVQEKWKSEITGGIVMDPFTGEIIAMGAAPNFDPNAYQTEKSTRVYINPMVQNVYEMGSIIKPLTIAAGLDMGAITAKTTYEDKGFIVLNEKRISNHDGGIPHGLVDMQEVLSQSLNTGVTFIMQKMGIQPFSNYMRNYGLAGPTGIDLPNEAKGLIKNLDSKREVEHATAAFGQGIAMTPIATIRALASLANGGYLPSPHVGKKIEYKLGFSKDISVEKGPQVIKKETSDEITRMLTIVVDKALRKGALSMPRYSIAAKTGTAQVANPAGGGYYTDRNLHSFFGYFPAKNPKYIVFLYTLHPKEIRYASETLTEPFFSLTKFLINYYEIPPDR